MNEHKKSAGFVVYYQIEGSGKPVSYIIEQQPALVRYNTIYLYYIGNLT